MRSEGEGRGLAASLQLAGAALLLFLLLPQRTLHGVDGEVFVVWIEQGRHDYARHVAYLHFAGWIHSWLQPLGGSAFASLLLASALGSAAAVFCLHRALRLLSPRRLGGGAAVLGVLSAAPLCFYATCAEVHGVFLAGAGAAWWAFARLLQRPSAAAALLLGLAIGFAGSLHAFGHLLLPSFWLAALLLRAMPLRACWRWLPCAALAHAAIALAIPFLLGHGAGGQAEDAAGHLAQQWAKLAPATLPEVGLREWLLPYAPWSLCAFAGLFAARSRPWALATLAMLAVHLPFTVLLLGFHRIDEGGAYHLAVLPAAALTAARLLRPQEFWAAVAGSALFAIHTAWPHWSEPAPPQFVAAVAELNAERPMTLLVGRRPELEGVRTGVSDLVAIDLAAALDLYAEQRTAGLDLGRWFDAWWQRLEPLGRPLLLTDSAQRFFAQADHPDVRAFWDEHVPRNYVVVPERRPGFSGAWLLRQSALR